MKLYPRILRSVLEVIVRFFPTKSEIKEMRQSPKSLKEIWEKKEEKINIPIQAMKTGRPSKVPKGRAQTDSRIFNHPRG